MTKPTKPTKSDSAQVSAAASTDSEAAQLSTETATAAKAAAAAITSPGVLLRRAREAQKLTIEQVAKELKLNKNYITEIETDTYTLITSAMYARGYLQAYGRLVGVNGDRLISAFNALGCLDRSPSARDPFALYTKHPSNTEQYWQWMIYGILGFIGIVFLFGIMHLYKKLTTPVLPPLTPLIKPVAIQQPTHQPPPVVHHTHNKKPRHQQNNPEPFDDNYGY